MFDSDADREVVYRSIPSYVKVRQWLVDYITERKLTSGARIPSDRTLAQAIGLSRPTVARAIQVLVNDGLLVREQRSGTFISNRLVKQCESSNTYTIGVITPWITQDRTGRITGIRVGGWQPDAPVGGDMMSLQIIHGVISVLNIHGHRLQIHSIQWAEAEESALKLLKNRLVDGALVVPMMHQGRTDLYKEIAAKGPPMVFVDHYVPGLDVDYVTSDNMNATREAIGCLIAKGHRRIAYFTDFGDMTSVLEREAGYRKALEEAGISIDEGIICGSQRLRGGGRDFFLPLKHCINKNDPVTAVFCMNDDIVWAAVQAADRLRLKVPDQLEIAGFFDDHIPPGIKVPFSRVVQATFDMGRIATDMLLQRISGEAPPEPRHILLPAQLIPRTP